LCQRIDAVMVRGQADLVLTGLASLQSAGVDDLSFLAFAPKGGVAGNSRAAAIFTSEKLAPHVADDTALLQVADPYFAYAQLANWIDAASQRRRNPAAGVHPSAVIDSSAQLGEQVSVGANAVIHALARVGPRSIIGAGSVIGAAADIGSDCWLAANVTVAHSCVIGDRVLIHSGTVVGADGFGYASNQGRWTKIPQLGAVRIGDDVEIGANCAIDRGALDDTIIEQGCKIDNLVQIAHNVRIGEHTAIAGCAGIAGSAVIGPRCRIGGGAGILGHLQICADATISAMSLVTRSISKPGFYTGVFPLQDNGAWEKSAALVKQLPAIRERLKALQKQMKSEP
jgi:UDP-3-O-[3-hydroxymyristoyl] glucosamine N-acyltransferase